MVLLTKLVCVKVKVFVRAFVRLEICLSLQVYAYDFDCNRFLKSLRESDLQNSNKVWIRKDRPTDISKNAKTNDAMPFARKTKGGKKQKKITLLFFLARGSESEAEGDFHPNSSDFFVATTHLFFDVSPA